MSNSPRFTVDANVLIYAAVADDPERHRIARTLMRRAVGRDCVLIVQALAEFFAASTRKAKLPADRASSLIESWLRLFPCQGATSETLRRALQIRATHRFSFWDAMLWAVARDAGCRYLLSENFQAGRALEGVTFVNPFAPGGLPAEVERALGDG
jgi:predicted nucleic acid-binding protein